MERRISASWAEEAADAVLERLAARPALRMCLATGSTPLPVYERLAHSPGAFASAAMLLLDEFGGLPADEPERCDAVLRRTLVDHVAPADYRSIDTEAPDLDAECTAIDAWIDAGPGGVIDLAVLGLGVNGHIGMNEPGSAVGRTARVELATSTVEGAQRYFGGRYRPTWGVTVGLADLLARRRGVGAGRRRDEGGDRAAQLRGAGRRRRAGVPAAHPPELHVVVGRRRRRSAVSPRPWR